MTVLYLHGLEGSPQGTKGAWVSQHYLKNTPSGPQMSAHIQLDDHTHDVVQMKPKIKELIPLCAQEARSAIMKRNPKVIIASSFGAAVLLHLMQDSRIRIPSVLIAQGAVFLDVADRFPNGSRAIVIHGTADKIIPYRQSVTLCQNSQSSVECWPIEGGDHRLHCLTTTSRALGLAIDKLLLEQGNKSDRERAESIVWPQ
ncbi:MAG: hypothetical protein VX278_09350 [Myxococcota bacterium]|nr:hypothetical protein [Myxococcota bacterium]